MSGPRTVSSYELGQIADGAATGLAAETAARIAGDAASVATASADATTKANAAQAAAIAASQPVNANLTALAGQTGAADRVSYWTNAATLALATFTSFGRTLLALADYAALKTGLSLNNVTNDAQVPLSAYTAADKILYSTAPSTVTTTGLTSSWRGALADTTSMAWDATNKVITIGPNTSPTGLILRTPSSPVPDPVNDGATFILSGQTYPFMYWKNTHASANKGMILGLNDTVGYFAVRDNWPLQIYTNNTLRITVAAAGVVTIATGLEVSDLTVNEGVYAGASGRLTRTRRLQIYATGTTNGTAGTSVGLTAAALGTSGDLRLIRLTVKAKGANVPPAKFARSLECFWGNAAGTLTQTGTDTLGTLYSSGNLAGATIASAASGTNVVVTCTDVTGVGATVTWELFGEYM